MDYLKSIKIKSNQTQIYTAPYIASDLEALGLVGLDRIGYVSGAYGLIIQPFVWN